MITIAGIIWACFVIYWMLVAFRSVFSGEWGEKPIDGEFDHCDSTEPR